MQTINSVMDESIVSFFDLLLEVILTHDDFEEFSKYNDIEDVYQIITELIEKTNTFYDFVLYGFKDVRIKFNNNYQDISFDFDVNFSSYAKNPYKRRKL